MKEASHKGPYILKFHFYQVPIIEKNMESRLLAAQEYSGEHDGQENTSWYRLSFKGNECILKLIVIIVTQLRKHTNSQMHTL